MTDTNELVDRVRPLLNNIATEFGHDEMCRTYSGWPDIVAKGCNCSRQEARDALVALSELQERLKVAERDLRKRIDERNAILLRAEAAERESNEWEQRYEELLSAVGGVWPG